MVALPAPLDLVPRALRRGATRQAYRAQQTAIRLPVLASHLLLRTVADRGSAPPSEAIEALRREYEALQERDLANVEAGHYPASLLFQIPLGRYARRVPDFEAEVIPQASERGIAVIAMKTCGNGFFFPANATKPDRIEEYGPPPGAWDRWDLPTWTDYIHYVLSLPIATATIGIDSFFTLEGVAAAASSFEPLETDRMASIHERSQIFSSTGYWIPRDARRGD